MSRGATLLGAGLSAQLARLLGVLIGTLAGTGTTQGAAQAIDDLTCVLATTAASQTAFVMKAGKPIGHRVEFYCTTATTALVFPESGATIDGGSANASVSVAQNKGRIFRKIAALTWVSVNGA